ncbi:hypothetical protein VQH23_09900 [Pararoseomonas sp. SCSIO 73927]|uniref:hypothetical protein n=1 Tax=Pararoseomonas sp. SCSIO 73927 TaxID=3114537 RepID=UPI0030CCCE60
MLLLLPDGTIGGYSNPAERRWEDRNGLCFLDQHGVVTTAFDDVTFENDRIVRLSGQARHRPSIWHVLERREVPSGKELGQSSGGVLPDFIGDPPSGTRRNLVVLRANSESLHKAWPREISDADRNWDLCVSYYGSALGSEAIAALEPFEYLTHQPADRKFGAIHALFTESSPLWNYQRVWFPDDDLATSWKDINRLFEICERHQLLLAQPALREGSYATHSITRQNPDYAMRFTNFVEVMCPVFSIEALRTCVGSFYGSISGFGLDRVWPRMLGSVHSRIAIIDEIAVTHTRPVAGNYDLRAAGREGTALQALYASQEPIRTVGGLLRQASTL